MKNKYKYLQHQQGAVMVTVLMLLVVITLMGLGSMKQGMFQARMGAGQVAYNSCFAAAESGLNAVLRANQQQVSDGVEMGDPDNFMNRALGENQYHCLTNDGLVTSVAGAACSNPMSVFAEIAVKTLSRKPNPDDILETSSRPGFEHDLLRGGAILIYTDSRCELAAMDMAVVNTQTWQYVLPHSTPNLDYTN